MWAYVYPDFLQYQSKNDLKNSQNETVKLESKSEKNYGS